MFKIMRKAEVQWMKDQNAKLRGRVWDLTQESNQLRRELAELKAKGTPRVRGAGGRWAKVDA